MSFRQNNLKRRKQLGMPTEIFQKPVPLETLFELLNKICPSSNEHYFLIDKTVHKKMLFHQYHSAFIATILPCYHKSKQFYVSRELTYNSFVNIVRQICNAHGHEIVADKKYNNSEYTIRYFVSKPTSVDALTSLVV
jgi:hypothetical protein